MNTHQGKGETVHRDCNVLMSMSSLRAKLTVCLFVTPAHPIHSRYEASWHRKAGIMRKQVCTVRHSGSERQEEESMKEKMQVVDK